MNCHYVNFMEANEGVDILSCLFFLLLLLLLLLDLYLLIVGAEDYCCI